MKEKPLRLTRADRESVFAFVDLAMLESLAGRSAVLSGHASTLAARNRSPEGALPPARSVVAAYRSAGGFFETLEVMFRRAAHAALFEAQSRQRAQRTPKGKRPRCGARCRDGHSCQARAVAGGTRCRRHGGSQQCDGQAVNRSVARLQARRLEAVVREVDRVPLALLWVRE